MQIQTELKSVLKRLAEVDARLARQRAYWNHAPRNAQAHTPRNAQARISP